MAVAIKRVCRGTERGDSDQVGLEGKAFSVQVRGKAEGEGRGKKEKEGRGGEGEGGRGRGAGGGAGSRGRLAALDQHWERAQQK